MELTPFQLGYIAGFFDGEGSISPGQNGQLYIRMGQRDPRPLEAIAEWLRSIGLDIRVRTRKARDDKVSYDLYIRGGAASELVFLRLIEPYLIHKREQAQVAIKYLLTRHNHVALTVEVIALRQSYRQALQTEKRRYRQ